MNMNEMKVFLRIKDVMTAVGLKRTAIYKAIKEGTFPAPIRIGAQAVAWDSGAIAKWQADRIAASCVQKAQKSTK